MLEWKIFYGDESTFDSSQGQPWEAPGDNVCCIVYPDQEVGRLVIQRWDWYYYKSAFDKEPAEWYGSDIHGLLDQLVNDRDNRIRAIKQGRTITNPLYKKILSKACSDENFNIKTAWQSFEINKGNN